MTLLKESSNLSYPNPEVDYCTISVLNSLPTKVPNLNLVTGEQWVGKIHQGDCLEVMRKMPDNLVDLVVTSPPIT